MTELIHKAEENSTLSFTRKLNCKTLPKYLVNVIEARRKVLKQLNKKRKSKVQSFETEDGTRKNLNFLTMIIRIEINAIQAKKWKDFGNKLNDLKPNTVEYWRKIKQISHLENKSNERKRIPDLVCNGNTFKSSSDKCEIFSNILTQVFSDSNDERFDNSHKNFIDESICEKGQNLFKTSPNYTYFDDKITKKELEDALKNLNKNTAPGPDKISNKHLVNFS